MTLGSSIENSTLVLSTFRGGRDSFMGRGRGGRSTYFLDDQDRLKCEHHSCFRHTEDQCWDLHGCPLDLALWSPSCGGFNTGRGGGRLGGQRPSAHLVTSLPTELPIMPPTSPYIGALSSEEIVAFRHFVS